MKRFILFIFLTTSIFVVFAGETSVNDLLARLDSMIDNEDIYVKAKLDKIEQIKRAEKHVRSYNG